MCDARELRWILAGLIGGLAVGIIFLLISAPAAVAVTKRLPGGSNEPVHAEGSGANSNAKEKVNIEGVFESFDGTPGSIGRASSRPLHFHL